VASMASKDHWGFTPTMQCKHSFTLVMLLVITEKSELTCFWRNEPLHRTMKIANLPRDPIHLEVDYFETPLSSRPVTLLPFLSLIGRMAGT
jgi:hypothetical protein